MGITSSKPAIQYYTDAKTGARPLVLIAQGEIMGKRVAAKLLPEYNVVRDVYSVAQAKEELPKLLNAAMRPKHIVFSKGFSEKRVREVREAVGEAEAGLCWYWTPSPPGEKLPNPGKIDEDMLDFFSGRIAAHVKEVVDKVIVEGGEQTGGVFEL